MVLTPEAEMILRLVLATFLGYFIGLERKLTGHPAGERTHALVSLGAASFTVLSFVAFPDAPSRMAANIVVGLGFLGAGTILKQTHHQIHGLTTAAGIWTVGALGAAIGAGRYGLGVTTAVLIWIILISERIFRLDERIERRLISKGGADKDLEE